MPRVSHPSPTGRLGAALVALTLLLPAAPAAAREGEALRVFLRAGPKTHGPGQHDHPRFLEEWRELLRERGAVVDGALGFPTAAQLEATDVLVFYAAEGGTIAVDDRANLARYLERGGGIVALHDAVCGNDAHWFKTIVGGAWEHGHAKWLEGPMGLYLAPEEHPITRGIPHFDLDDEIYYDLHLADEGVQVLGNSFRTVFDVEPQMWTYEPGDYRAFVSIQGHNHTTFSHPAWRAIVLRGIAWAGRRDADSFVTADELAGLRYPPGGPTPPERAHEAFELHPDFEIELVASEPAVVNPISIDWDHRGRMWIASTPGYPYKEEFSGIPARDRILILNDEGQVASVFYEGLDLVTSLLVHQDGVIVTASPEILYLADTDGDDVADQKTVLFSGFGYGDTHATVSNMRWGLDGWVYATQGYSGNASKNIVGADGVDHGHIPNGLFRFRPDGSAIELISSYGSNTWGLDFAPDGELFFTMANGAHARHVVLEESILADARVGGVNSWKTIEDHDRVHPITAGKSGTKNEQIDFVGGFTAAAGCLIYDGGAWPAEFNGNQFVCEPTVNLVHRDRIVPEGVTFRAEKPREAEFLASRDYWFRPVHLRTGPDGAMYVLDFYNQAVVHNDTRGPKHGPTNAAVRPDRDRVHGRIWRVQARGATATGPGAMTRSRATADLADSNGWYRSTAMRLIREQGGELGSLEMGGLPPAGLIAALWLAGDERTIAAHLSHPDAGVRANAARLASSYTNSPAMLGALVRTACADTAPRVRLRALEALAAPGACNFDGDDTSRLVRLDLDDDWSRSVLIRAVARAKFVFLMAASMGAEGTLIELVRQAARSGDTGRVNDALVGLGSCDAQGEALATALRALERGLGAGFDPVVDHRSARALRSFLRHDDLAVAVAALPLVVRWNAGDAVELHVNELCERLLAQLRDGDTDYAQSLSALPALLSVEAFRAAAIEETPAFLKSFVPLDVQLAAIEALNRTNELRAAEVLCAALPELGTTVSEAAFEVLLARPDRAGVLLDAVEAGDVGRHLVGARRAHRLRTYQDADVVRRAEQLLPASSVSVDERMVQLLPVVELPGDVARGKQLFAQECGICHVFEGEGTKIGPELTGMGSHGVEELLGVILDPNAEIEPAFVEYVARTLDGVVHTGIVVRETKGAIVLRNTGGDVELARADLESLRSSGLSLMPTGLEAMGPEALRDLLAYMTEAYQGYRVLDLGTLANTSSLRGLFNPSDWSGWGRFERFGVINVEGTPFEVPDPELVPGGKNVLVLRGGPEGDWASKTTYPLEVEIPIGREVEQVHVLGGVAGWGVPWGKTTGEDVVRWTWRYVDGEQEHVMLRNGVEFADWIGRYDVPGSTLVEGLVAKGAPGQVRRFALSPAREVAVESIVLRSADSHVSPVFLALTAELEGAEPLAVEATQVPTPERVEADCFLLGGGSSHDFPRWFGEVDAKRLASSGRTPYYTENPDLLLSSLDAGDVLVLSTNQPLSQRVREKIAAHVQGGGGLVALHAGTWANWGDWTEMGRDLVRAQASSHEPLRGFAVEVIDPDHPIVAGVALRFDIVDELYRIAPVEGAAPIEVVAQGSGDETYPVVWTAGRVVGITLGHGGAAHELPAFQQLLTQAVAWLSQ